MQSTDDLVRAAAPAYRRGTSHPLSKLDDSKVRMAREAVARGASRSGVARALGVSRRTITCVVERLTWKHVE